MVKYSFIVYEYFVHNAMIKLLHGRICKGKMTCLMSSIPQPFTDVPSMERTRSETLIWPLLAAANPGMISCIRSIVNVKGDVYPTKTHFSTSHLILKIRI